MSKDDSKLETVTFYPHSDEKAKNDSSSAASAAATGKKLNYFKWILSSWIHPGEEVEGAKWYGVVTIVAELLVFFGALYRFFHVLVKNSFFGANINNIFYVLNGGKSSIAELLVYLKLFIFSLIAAAIIIGGTYLVSRYLVSGKKENFWTYTNRITHYSGINVILTLVILVLGLFGIAGRAISLLTLFASAIFGIAVLVAVISRSNEEGLDRIYAGIVTALVMGLGFFIFYLLSSEIIMKVISFGVQVFMMMMGGGLQ